MGKGQQSKQKRRQKPTQRRRVSKASRSRSDETAGRPGRDQAANLLFLQRAIGNRSVSHMIEAHKPAGRAIHAPHQADVQRQAGSETSTAAASHPYPGRLLRFGSSGEHVRTAQMLLNQHGQELETDGIFGSLTRQAVLNFQQTQALSVDGIIGPNTWAALAAGGKTTEDKPADYGGYTSELQKQYGELLDENTTAQTVNEIIASLFGELPGNPAGGEIVFTSHLDQPWTNQDAGGLQTLLKKVEAMLNQWGQGFQIGTVTFPVTGIRHRNMLLRVAQEGKFGPALKQLLPPALHPLAAGIVQDEALRRSIIPVLIFLNQAEGYRRLIAATLALKQQEPQNAADHAQRLAFVHRALSFAGAIESQAADGETARATVGKQGYTTNPENEKKPKTENEYPLRKGHALFDQMWMESVDEGYYQTNDRWGPGSQYGDHIRLLRSPDLPSWCGIYVNWIAIQEGMTSTKWKQGGQNVMHANWSSYPAAWIPHKGVKPGDLLYAHNHNQHQCLAISFDPETGMVTSIDGNTAPGGGTTGGQILVQERHYTWFTHVYRFKQ